MKDSHFKSSFYSFEAKYHSSRCCSRLKMLLKILLERKKQRDGRRFGPCTLHCSNSGISPFFCKKTHQILIASRWTATPGKTVGPYSALKVLSESGFHVIRYWIPVGVRFTARSQPGLQVLLNNSIEDVLLGGSGLPPLFSIPPTEPGPRASPTVTSPFTPSPSSTWCAACGDPLCDDPFYSDLLCNDLFLTFRSLT